MKLNVSIDYNEGDRTLLLRIYENRITCTHHHVMMGWMKRRARVKLFKKFRLLAIVSYGGEGQYNSRITNVVLYNRCCIALIVICMTGNRVEGAPVKHHCHYTGT